MAFLSRLCSRTGRDAVCTTKLETLELKSAELTEDNKEDYLNCLKEIYAVDYGYRDVAKRVEDSYMDS